MTTLARARAASRLMIFDVDGVLTDGSLHYGADGEADQDLQRARRPWHQAAAAIGRAHRHHQRAPVADRGAARGRPRHRARAAGRARQARRLRAAAGATAVSTAEQCGFIGDDVIDLPVLTRVGFAASVPNGHPEVLRRVHYVTERRRRPRRGARNVRLRPARAGQLRGGAGAVPEMKQRSHARVSTTARMLLLAMLIAARAAAASGCCRSCARPGSDAGRRRRANEPDYYRRQIQFRAHVRRRRGAATAISGQAHDAPSGRRHAYESNRPSSTASARAAADDSARRARPVSNTDGSKVHMYDNVRSTVPRKRRSAKCALAVRLPDGVARRRHHAHRQAGADRRSARSTLTGTGMVANNATGELRLASRVQATCRRARPHAEAPRSTNALP